MIESLAGTGHRPERLGGYEVYPRLVDYARYILPSYAPKEVISGMATGWDMALAEASESLGIDFIAAVPFEGQENLWPEDARIHYRRLLSKAKRVVIVSEGGYQFKKYEVRDRWMVDHSIALLGLWDGKKNGGTYKTIKYAQSIGRVVHNVWPGWEEFGLCDQANTIKSS